MYASIRLEQQLLLLGPVRVYSYSAMKHNLDINLDNLTSSYAVPDCPIEVFLQNAALLHNLFQSNTITTDDIFRYNQTEYKNTDVEKYYNEILFQDRETEDHLTTYSNEAVMLSCIENGNIDLLKINISEEHGKPNSVMASDFDRSIKNTCICVIALISRAAIRGGVNTELAFSMCTSYINQIEEVKNLGYLKPLVEGAKMRFASMVHDLMLGK